MSRRLEIRDGTRFGKLVVVGESESRKSPSGQTKRRMMCKCDCGNETVSLLTNLRKGHSTSCGCTQRAAGRGNRTHGYSGTPTYRAWQDMIQRCHNPARPGYATYGARGIVVCQRWRDSFEAFLEDMGEVPSPSRSIDREDNDGNYEPGNCRWATRQEQSRNTTRNINLTHNGETACLAEWADRLGMSYGTLHSRLLTGWSVEDALTIPVGGPK